MSESYTAEAIAAAREYFHQPEPRFWVWSDDTISWTDGTTIVFHRELAEIMRRLAMDGLPPLTPLLLLLAACRDSYRSDRVREALSRESLSTVTFMSEFGRDDGIKMLDRLAALPADLRSTVDGKVVLIEAVFAGRRSFAVKDALNAAAVLGGRSPDELLADDRPSAIQPHISLALLAFHAVKDLDVEKLRLRLRTGLEQLVEPAEIEPAPDESLRTFISRLRDDPELSGLGRLAHDLMAAVQVPRAISEPEDLRLGGVSDIANRGPLDRLLTSELAHDDLTLAVRVAVGEALYLRREAPPRTPVRERHLLIDCGIRLWGVPRVFAAAVALALAATADRHTKALAWRATADGIERVNLSTREGLIVLLEQLEATPQPALALERFLEAVDDTATSADAILVTHEGVLVDPDFRRALDELQRRQLYIASVDREGRFRLSVRSGRGTKLIREARFDLDRVLLPPRRPTVPLIRRDTGSDLPAILSVEPFPLLLPHQVRFDRLAFRPAYGAVTLTHDGRLMHWAKAGRGATQVTASVPRGPFRHLSIDEEGVVRLITGGSPSGPLQLVRANIINGDVRIVKVSVDFEEPINIVRDNQVIYLIGKRSIRVITDEGEATPEVECRFRHVGRRFFAWGVWYALSFDGQSPRLTRVPIHRSIALGSIASMFDIAGREGPWIVTDQGQIVSTVDGSVFAAPRPTTGHVSVVAISDDGHRVILDDPHKLGTYHRFYLNPDGEPAWELCAAYDPKWEVVYPESASIVSSQSMMWRVFLISADRDGRLALTSRRGPVWRVDMEPHQSRLVMLCRAAPPPRLTQPFQPTDNPPNVRFRLRIARWADGSRAWIDSRGLLHLKSSDRSLPELTIVLVQNREVTAWASDGRIWGATFYTGVERGEARPAEELLAAIDAYVARLK